MSFDEIWIHVVATLREHAVKLVTGFVLMAVGWYIGKRRLIGRSRSSSIGSMCR